MTSKQVNGFGKKITYTIGALMLFAAATFYIKNKFFRAGFKHYKEFGIDMPTNYSIHGIDVSHYQEDIDWALVKNMKVGNIAIEFAFIKATEGTNNVDDQLKENMEGCKENNIKRGAYHYFLPFKSGISQAANFIENVHLSNGDLPPVLDIEQNNGCTPEQMHDRIAEWLNLVEKKYNVKPIIYCNVNYYENYIAGKFDEYPIWIAHYLVKDKPRINSNWVFWQHNENGHVTGIRSTSVDFNVFNGSRWNFNKLLINN